MISATPNSVRWDQVNRVTYRFQALNFQSDVLEALVLNSPPLTRRSRRKPIIRTTKSDSAGNKVEFLKARHLVGRILSFDSGISGEQRNEVNFKEKSRVSHDRYVAMGFTAKGVCENPKLTTETVYTCGRDAVRRPSYKSRSLEDVRSTKEDVKEEITKINGLRQHSDVSVEIGDDDNDDDGDDDDDNNDDSHVGDDDNDLENQSKEYLIQLVKDLREELRKQTENVQANEEHDTLILPTESNNSTCCHCGQSVEVDRLHPPVKSSQEDSPSKMALATQMKQLESEVHRTRKIATLFEDELSSLKERFSNILVKSKTLNGYDPTKSRVYRHTAKPVPSRDKEKITCEQKTVINAEEEKEFSSGSRNLVNNAEEETKLCNYSRETMNSASRKGSNNIINDCDPVPVIG